MERENKNNNKNRINKKAQVAIFIIIAVLVVGIIIFFFFFRSKIDFGLGQSGKPEKDPESYINLCIKPKVEEAVKLISSQGGYVNNSLNKNIDGEKISYLCYQQNYYISCVNQEPMLISHLEEEIKNYIKDDVDGCLAELKNELVKQNYEVSISNGDFNVQLVPKKVLVNINRKIEITKSGETSRYEKFQSVIPSRIYELALVVQEITSQEARFCNFEQGGYMLFYSNFDIDKFRTGDGTTLYTIKHRKTNEEFKFAVRSCVIPPGI